MGGDTQGSADECQGARYRHAQGRETCGHYDDHDHEAHLRGCEAVRGLRAGSLA
ncbi:hypothetical protein [Streptomyces davaonensis]|uniref:hypothetical protein n=1 Tax=Streptomyces davaonensis TaxID=348043 RepID=UPI0003496906|nr:hypothetical protein [Streptomyces davaonensis]